MINNTGKKELLKKATEKRKIENGNTYSSTNTHTHTDIRNTMVNVSNPFIKKDNIYLRSNSFDATLSISRPIRMYPFVKSDQQMPNPIFVFIFIII